MNPDDVVLLGRELVARRDATISPFDRGLLYGDGFFETTRVVDGMALFLDRHLARLARSCEAAAFEEGLDSEELAEDLARLIRANGVEEGYLRVTVTRGLHEGRLTEAGGPPTVFGEARATELTPLDETPAITLTISPYRVSHESPTAGHKSLSYQSNLLALAEARSRGSDDALLLNSADELCECTISNLFLVVGDCVRTPAESCGPLPGVTRAAVLDLCSDLELHGEEGRWNVGDLQAAEEVFCTNSLRGIMPVSEVAGVCVALPAPGPVTDTLQAAYAAAVTRWCAEAR